MTVHVVLDDARQLIEFRTARLVATKLALADAAFLEQMHADTEVMSDIGGALLPGQSATWLTNRLRHWDDHGFGQWTLRLRDGTPVGRTGLGWVDESEMLVSMDLALRRSAWGRGYATEAGRGLAALAAGFYELDQLWAVMFSERSHSLHLLDKLGFTLRHRIEMAGEDATLYQLPLDPDANLICG